MIGHLFVDVFVFCRSCMYFSSLVKLFKQCLFKEVPFRFKIRVLSISALKQSHSAKLTGAEGPEFLFVRKRASLQFLESSQQ